MTASTRRLIENQLDDLDDTERDLSLLRVGGAMIVLTVSLWSAYTTYYAQLALKRGWRFLRAVVALAVVVTVYRVATYGARKLIERSVRTAAAAVRRQDTIDNRLAAVAAAGVFLGLAYGVLRLARWCVRPFTGIIEMASPHPTPAPEDADLTEFAADSND